MHVVLMLLFVAALSHPAIGQKVFSAGDATVKFVSTKNSDVTAINNHVNATVTELGEISFSLLIREFKFDMVEMEEHFNKNYLESDKYPEASFKGRIFDFKKIDLTRPGVYKVKAEGQMTIHNVTKRVVAAGILQVERNAIILNSKFAINISDFNIDTGLGGVIIGSKMNVEVRAACQ